MDRLATLSFHYLYVTLLMFTKKDGKGNESIESNTTFLYLFLKKTIEQKGQQDGNKYNGWQVFWGFEKNRPEVWQLFGKKCESLSAGPLSGRVPSSPSSRRRGLSSNL